MQDIAIGFAIVGCVLLFIIVFSLGQIISLLRNIHEILRS